jgi:hypothetical protein
MRIRTVKAHFVCLAFVSISCLCLADPACYAQDPYAPLEKIIQDEGYVPHFPLSDTIHPGGLAKLCGSSKTYDFIPLAEGAKIAETTPALFQWATATSDKKTTLSALLGAVSSILSGVSITVDANAQQAIDLNQISAGGLALKFDTLSVLGDDPVLRQEVRNYQSACKVFMVTEVATTNAISFTTDKAIGASVHVNDPTADSSCVPPPAPAAAATVPAAAAAAPAAAAPAASAAAGKSTASTAAPSEPSAHLAACMTSANQITLNSPNPLTFAVKLESLNKMPQELVAATPTLPAQQPAAAVSAASLFNMSGVPSSKVVPVKGYTISGMANSTATQNILKTQYQRANELTIK